MKLQTKSTPERCLNQIVGDCKCVDIGTLIDIFSFTGLPLEIARNNIALFTNKLLLKLMIKTITGTIDWAA